MMRFLRENMYASIGLLFLRLYLGWQWMTAGWGKIGTFDATGFLKGAIAKAGGENPTVSAWWGSFLESFALPNVGLFNIMVSWGEFLVGLGLILGCLTTAAVFFGMVMNFAFMFSGTLSSNPLMVLLGIFVLVAGANAGRIGLDNWVLPYIKSLFKKDTTKDHHHTPGTPDQPKAA